MRDVSCPVMLARSRIESAVLEIRAPKLAEGESAMLPYVERAVRVGPGMLLLLGLLSGAARARRRRLNVWCQKSSEFHDNGRPDEMTILEAGRRGLLQALGYSCSGLEIICRSQFRSGPPSPAVPPPPWCRRAPRPGPRPMPQPCHFLRDVCGVAAGCGSG